MSILTAIIAAAGIPTGYFLHRIIPKEREPTPQLLNSICKILLATMGIMLIIKNDTILFALTIIAAGLYFWKKAIGVTIALIIIISLTKDSFLIALLCFGYFMLHFIAVLHNKKQSP